MIIWPSGGLGICYIVVAIHVLCPTSNIKLHSMKIYNLFIHFNIYFVQYNTRFRNSSCRVCNGTQPPHRHGGAVAEWVRALACTGNRTVRIPLRTTSLRNFGNSVYASLPVSFRGDTKSCWSLLSDVYARGRKISHQSALECVTVVDSTTHSTPRPPGCYYAAENAALHLYRKKKKKIVPPFKTVVNEFILNKN